MANQIRVRTPVEVVNDNSIANEGTAAGDYTNLNLDVHADSRTWGGSYDIATDKHSDGAYNSSDICYWKNVIVSDTSASGGLGDNTWNKTTAAPVGNVPTTAHVVAVEYVSQTGTAVVAVQIFGQTIATLSVGQSVVIPIDAGEAVADIDIFSAAYSSGVHEATVNVMIAGV